jgi:hypothetical protein
LTEFDKYKKELKGKLKVILINTRMEVIKIMLNKNETIEKVIDENFYNPKDKLFHYIRNKKSNDLILYSIDKPMVLDRLMESGRIIAIKPYEFMLLKKYSPKKNILFKLHEPKKKNTKKIIIHSDFGRLFLLAMDEDELVYSKNININEFRDLNNYIKLLKTKILKEKDDEIEFNFGNIEKAYLDKVLAMEEVEVKSEEV